MLARFRASYGCDCDGVSHTLPPPDESTREARKIRDGVFKIMETITGYHPPTCPWRVMYSPLVREVIAAMEHEENGNLAVALGSDPPGILVDAIGVYKQALAATRAEDAKLRAQANKPPPQPSRGRR